MEAVTLLSCCPTARPLEEELVRLKAPVVAMWHDYSEMLRAYTYSCVRSGIHGLDPVQPVGSAVCGVSTRMIYFYRSICHGPDVEVAHRA